MTIADKTTEPQLNIFFYKSCQGHAIYFYSIHRNPKTIGTKVWGIAMIGKTMLFFFFLKKNGPWKCGLQKQLNALNAT